MPESRIGPPPDDDRRPPLPSTTAASTGASEVLADLDEMAQLDGEPTDDSPTIISKNAPRQGSPEEVLLGSLRGHHLAHFELLEPIGVGGMAAVLRARDTQLDRFVALKILPPDMAHDLENVRRFHQEARSAAKLDHENIARVFFCGEDRRLHFIAFEFVEGDNLRTILERRGRLPVGEALHYVLQIAAGLAHASRRGVVHRDIKPSNIIITPNGRAKLVDMGLARSLEPRNEKDLTQSGVTLGTFDYISPEQALEPRDADVRSDLYSLGCTFYHMLTGQPPVPEGTAAKKLHHHQHIRPPDPRQLVPDLPDEAAVVLDRMMAKQPKDRYQSPDHLVHHLLLASRKLGGSPEVPDGVMSVEAALPSPPGSRPLLLTALAAIAVIGLILLLDQSSSSLTPAPTPAINRDVPDPSGKPVVGAPGPGNPPKLKAPLEHSNPPQPAPVAAVYDSEEQGAPPLADWLQRNQDAPSIKILLGRDLDLSNPPGGEAAMMGKGRNEPGLLIKAPVVILRARDPARRPTIRLTYNGKVQNAPWAALTIESERATVEGVRFLVDATASPVELTALVLRGGKEHRISQCEFLQAQPSSDEPRRLVSVLVEEGASRVRPALRLNECCFLGFKEQKQDVMEPARPGLTGADAGGHAVVRRGAVSLTAINCAFGPHAAVFRLEGGSAEDGLKTVIRHCSMMAASSSAVFLLPEGASAALDVEASLFARLGERPAAGMDDKPAVLIRQTGVEASVTYAGLNNRYYLDGYWPGSDGAADWKSFLNRKPDCRDEGSRELSLSPWKDAQPLKRLEALDLAPAFQPNTRSRELRLSAAEGKFDRLAGVEVVDRTSYLVNLPALERQPLVVEPGKDDSSNGIYSTLEQAIAAARPRDVILIKDNETLRLDPILLTKDTIDLTIRPARGYRPTLTLGDPEDRDPDVALFRLRNGKLRLENLQFLLRPGDKYKVQALVALVGDGQCTFKNCVVTLDRDGRTTRLALATILDPGKMMKTDKKPGPPSVRVEDLFPRLVLEDCLVRGEGDLLWSRIGRPCELEAKNTLVVLTGSLLHAEAGWDNTTPAGQKVLVRLTHVTTYLTGHLFRLGAGKGGKGLAPILCKPVDSLFAAPPGERVLVHLDGPEAEESVLKDRLGWEGSHNAYSVFRRMLEQQPSGDDPMTMPLPFTTEKWKTFTGESMSKHGVTAAFAAPPATSAFIEATPLQFKPLEDVDGFGADVTQVAAPPRSAATPK